MKKITMILMLYLTLSGCGVKLDHELSGSVEIVHSINLDSLYAFFLKTCNQDKACADEKINDFLEWFYNQGNQGVPTP